MTARSNSEPVARDLHRAEIRAELAVDQPVELHHAADVGRADHRQLALASQPERRHRDRMPPAESLAERRALGRSRKRLTPEPTRLPASG